VELVVELSLAAVVELLVDLGLLLALLAEGQAQSQFFHSFR
jgi:hypothetical protein